MMAGRLSTADYRRLATVLRVLGEAGLKPTLARLGLIRTQNVQSFDDAEAEALTLMPPIGMGAISPTRLDVDELFFAVVFGGNMRIIGKDVHITNRQGLLALRPGSRGATAATRLA